MSNDIALLWMDPPLDIAGSKGYVNGICLPKPCENATGTATITGWGRLVENGSFPDTLQSAAVPIRDNSVCEDFFETRNDTADDDYITDSKISAAGATTDASNNLIKMNYLAGMLMSLSVALTIGLPTDVFQFLNQTKLHATLQLAGCGKSIVPEEGPDRIVGGRMALPGEFPWMVSLREKDSLGFEHVCGGAILNRNWIITAAHCLDSTSTRMYDVMVGLHRLSKEYTAQAKLHKLSKIILHENYDDDTFENDIALLKTSKPIDIAGSGGYVNGVCLPTSSKDPTGTATVSGWGHTRSEGENADTLRTVDVPMVPRDMCNYAYDEDPYDAFDEVLESMICAGSRGRDSCQNDSGGPLIQRKNGKATLIGIVSHGNGCGLKYFPGVYTKVSYFMKWIERNAV